MPISEDISRRFNIRWDLQAGDLGYVLSLHGRLYRPEYGWDQSFEGYVAQTLAEFSMNYNPQTDRLWVAEQQGGKICATIGVVGRAENEAQLRWFMALPGQRGQGLGRALMDEALAFCRSWGARNVFLWTVSQLQPAARLYHAAGFSKTEERTHPLWGALITEERYDLAL